MLEYFLRRWERSIQVCWSKGAFATFSPLYLIIITISQCAEHHVVGFPFGQKTGSKSKPIDVSVAGVKVLRLEVQAVSSNACAHGVFVNPALHKPAGAGTDAGAGGDATPEGGNLCVVCVCFFHVPFLTGE